MNRLTLLPLCIIVAPAAWPADVVVVEGDYLAARQPGEGAGMQRYTKNVTDALDMAGVEWEMSSDSAVENENALDGKRVAIFPHNGTLPEGEVAAVERFMDAGGKIIIFYALPAKLAARIGIETAGYQTGDDARFTFATVGFDAPDVLGLPDSMKQGSWNIGGFAPTEDGARIIGTWVSEDGEDTEIPAVSLSDSGAAMNHVLLNGGPEAASFLMAVIGHWYPDAWEAAVDRALGKSEQFGRYSSSVEMWAALGRMDDSPGVRANMAALARADMIRDDAHALADDGQWPEALDTLATIPGTLGSAYAKLYPSRPGEMRAVWIHSPFNVKDWDVACRHLRKAGFNAVIVNMCNAAISYYPSEYLREHPRAAEEGDQILRVLEACRENGIELHVWRVNWNAGGNDERIDEMKRLGINAASKDGTPGGWLCASRPENKQHEVDTMLEIAENYDVDGIHFDYIRYHNSSYCYCDFCRESFEAQTGVTINEWPLDVMDGGPEGLRDKWLQYRREQINEVVKTVSERVRESRPGTKISAAVFGEWAASRLSIGQDAKLWVDNGWLDFVCPMDYTQNTDYLERLTRMQVEAVAGQKPLYIGLGAWRHETIATLVDQIQASRDLGADGFVLFSYEAGLTDEFITELGKGQTKKQTYSPHHAPVCEIAVPDGKYEHQSYTWAAGEDIQVKVSLTAQGTMPYDVESTQASLVLETAAGDRLETLGKMSTKDALTRFVNVTIPEGRSRVSLYGTMRYEDGTSAPFVHRGPRLGGLSAAEVEEIRAANEPPVFEGEGVKVGVSVALDADPDLQALPLNKLTSEFLAACDVVVLAQFRNPASGFSKESQDALVEWVRGGGRVMCMHDAVGYRIHPVLFPEVGKGVAVGEGRDVTLFTGDRFEHSYYDHILIEAAPGTIVGATDPGGGAVTVGGEAGAGKVVLNGMVTGLATGDVEVAPEGGERDLLLLSVKWLAQ